MDSSADGASSGERKGVAVAEEGSPTPSPSTSSPKPKTKKSKRSGSLIGGFVPSSSQRRPGAAPPPVLPAAPKPALKGRDAYRNGPRSVLSSSSEALPSPSSPSGSPLSSPKSSKAAHASFAAAMSVAGAASATAAAITSGALTSPRSPKESPRSSPRNRRSEWRHAHSSSEDLKAMQQTPDSEKGEKGEKSEKTSEKAERRRGPALRHRSISSSRLVETSSSMLDPSRRRAAAHEDAGMPILTASAMSASKTFISGAQSPPDGTTPDRTKAKMTKKKTFGSLSRSSIRTSLRKGIWGAADEDHQEGEDIEQQPPPQRPQGAPSVSHPTLVSRPSDLSQAKTFMVGKDALTAEEREWVTQTPNILQWSDEYSPEVEEKSLIQQVDGFMRELGRPVFTDAYARIDPKVANAFPLIEADKYRHYYKDYLLHTGDVENFVSHIEDEHVMGPVVVCCESGNRDQARLKVLIHTRKGTDRTFVPNDGTNRIKSLKALQPGLGPIRFLRVKDSRFSQDMVDYEDKLIATKYKFGILYGRANQSTEDQMYNNEHGSALFEEFLDMLGERVRMLGFRRFRGGLDAKRDTTGSHSVYTEYRGQEVMFHVSTLLPFFPEDPQQVERKRHLGNDVVIVIFREGSNEQFSPLTIRSQFNHVYIVITPHKEGKKKTTYRMAVVCKHGVRPFGPSLPEPAVFKRGRKFREFLLTKMINGERAAFHAKDFVHKFNNTRRIQLHDVVERYSEGAVSAERNTILARLSRSTSSMAQTPLSAQPPKPQA